MIVIERVCQKISHICPDFGVKPLLCQTEMKMLASITCILLFTYGVYNGTEIHIFLCFEVQFNLNIVNFKFELVIYTQNSISINISKI